MDKKTTIYTKLMEFQKLGISIKKDANNPHFKSKYADLSEVIGKVRPALTQCGIVMIQTPDADGLVTTLRDPDSDTEVTGRINFVGATDAQKLGSNLTYFRRYSLVSMLGLEDDDDDGNTATQASKPAAKPVAKPAAQMTTAEALEKIVGANSLPALQAVWKSIPRKVQEDVEVLAMKDERKEYLTNQETA